MCVRVSLRTDGNALLTRRAFDEHLVETDVAPIAQLVGMARVHSRSSETHVAAAARETRRSTTILRELNEAQREDPREPPHVAPGSPQRSWPRS